MFPLLFKIQQPRARHHWRFNIKKIMKNQTVWLIGVIFSGILVAIFIGLLLSGRSTLQTSIKGPLLDRNLLKEQLPLLDQRQINGDLPIKLKSDDIQRDNPFEILP